MAELITMPRYDLHRVLTRAPRDVVAMVKKGNGTIWLAGGYIRAILGNEEPNDIDIFGTSKDQLKIIATNLCDERNKRGVATKQHVTKNAITVLSADNRAPIQFITRWSYSETDAVCESFDYTVCQAAIAYVGHVWVGRMSSRFYRDLAAKRLVYTDPIREEEAGGSMMRALKFTKRGYNIQTASLGRVMARVVAGIKPERNIDMKDTTAVGFVLGGLLEEVDPTLVVDGIDLIDDHETVNEDVAGILPQVSTYNISGSGE